MKSIILILSLFSLSSFAQSVGKPFQLDNGKYSTECWYVGLTNTKDGAYRYNSYEKGTSTIVNQGATNIEYSQTQSEYDVRNSVIKTSVIDLGNGLFKQITESTDTDSFGDKTETESYKFETTIKVDGNNSQTLTVKKNNEAEQPGVGELVWSEMDDGRVVVQSYLREKRSYVTADGEKRERVVANSHCTYTPIR